MVNEWRASSLKTSPYIPPYFIQATLILSFPICFRCRLLPIRTMLLLAKEIHHFLHAALHFWVARIVVLWLRLAGSFHIKDKATATSLMVRHSCSSMSEKLILYNNIEDPDDLLAADEENKFSSTDLVSYFFDSIKQNKSSLGGQKFEKRDPRPLRSIIPSRSST